MSYIISWLSGMRSPMGHPGFPTTSRGVPSPVGFLAPSVPHPLVFPCEAQWDIPWDLISTWNPTWYPMEWDPMGYRCSHGNISLNPVGLPTFLGFPWEAHGIPTIGPHGIIGIPSGTLVPTGTPYEIPWDFPWDIPHPAHGNIP